MRTLDFLALCGVIAVSSAIQTGDARAQSVAYIQQVGQDNRAEIFQESSPESAASIKQEGSFNGHRIEQRNGFYNYATIMAVGEGNGGGTGSVIRQSGSHQTALALSAGSDNGFAVQQRGGYGANLAALVQTGDDNRATATQYNTTAPTAAAMSAGTAFAAVARGIDITGGGATLAAQIQGMVLGTANASVQLQVGTGNTAEITQMGQGNLAIQTQIGHDNTMSAAQIGDGKFLAHTQIGNGLVGPEIAQGHQNMTIVQFRP